MHIEAKLRKLGLELPEVKKPAGLYVFTLKVVQNRHDTQVKMTF